MLKKTSVLLTITALISCGPSEKMVIKGSETMHTMLEILEDDYETTIEDMNIVIQGGGSTTGIDALIQEQVDAAAASRELSQQEIANLARTAPYEQQLLAFDGVALVVNSENPVNKLTLSQASDIFSGKITNWSEIGGPDLPVKIISRDKKSGTYRFILEYVVRQHDAGDAAYADNMPNNYAEKNTYFVNNNEELVEQITDNRGAIGYMGMGSVVTEGDGDVKKLAYARTSDEEFVVPTVKSVFNRRYKLSRGLYLFYYTRNQKASKFIEYCLSDRGQNRIEAAGYLKGTFNAIEVKGRKQ